MTLTADEIGQIVVVVVLLLTAAANYLNHLATQKSVNEVHLQVNSRMDQLLITSNAAAHQSGIEEGKAASGGS